MQLLFLSSPLHHCSSNMSRISPFPLIVLFFLLCAFFSVQGCPPHEREALLRFRSSLNDTYEKLRSWNTDDCCQWIGVECNGSEEERHVSKLDLRYFWISSINGEIDSSLFEMKNLNYLDLYSIEFHSEIPPQVGNLSFLSHLDLSCVFCVINPTSSNLQWLSNLSSLEYLSLSGVKVSDKSWGSIIGSLHLKYLDLSWCSLPAPSIPNTLLNLSVLTFLDLGGNSFSEIPSWIPKLSSLTHLGLAGNKMSGSIQNTIKNLTGLEYLDLSYNALTGEIPLSLGHNVRQYGRLSNLNLKSNNLEGRIPTSLANLQNLRYLDLSSNQLSGSLPDSFAHLSSLAHLIVNDNHLNESIPSALMLPSSLQQLDLSNNYINGTITEVFFQKSLKLKHLDLSHSRLTLNISSTWIPSFQLNTLLLEKCRIGGPIPSWISTQFSLHTLSLSSNQLIGDLPSWLWDIYEVQLSDNHLQGSFAPASGSLSYLDLSMNELSGRLPADIHIQLSKIKVLVLAYNKLEGQIPFSIVNLTYLSILDMSNNYLTGNLLATLGNMTHLQVLNLQNNYLEGDIPNEIGKLSDLQSFRIGKNSMLGILPSSLINLSRLQVLDVGENNFTGNIPDWIANFSSLEVLVMRSNNFTGILPPDIGRMPNLQVLDLSSNSFSGTIPQSYFRFPAMLNISSGGGLVYWDFTTYGAYSNNMDLTIKGQEMHYEHVLPNFVCIDLSNSGLSGPLPLEIENLKGLMYLNLSMNSLSGPIPESLGILVQLESVDLSFNKFSGRIPWQIGNLTSLARLNLSYNSLAGRIPEQGGQMLTFDKWSYIGNPNLWGCPLDRNCSNRASPPPAVVVEENGDEGLEFLWYWMCFGLSVGVGFAGVVMVLVLKLSWRIKCFEAMDRVIEVIDIVICILLKR